LVAAKGGVEPLRECVFGSLPAELREVFQETLTETRVGVCPAFDLDEYFARDSTRIS